MFGEPLAGQLGHFARLVEPHLPRLDAALRRYMKAAAPAQPCDRRQLKALLLITSGAAARVVSAGRPVADFFEQVAYNGRRLAKLNVPPMEVVEALREYDRELDRLLAKRYPRQHAALQAVRQQLHFRTLLAINNAYYQVREAETQAFYGLLRAETEAAGLDDLLHRFILILTRTFRAQAGRMIPLTDRPPIASRVLKRLAQPCYIATGSPDEELVLDAGMRGVFQSYWSIPFFSGGHLAGLVQFGFPTPYRWLPRELDLLNAFAERCLRGADRTRLIRDLAAREEQVRSLAAHLLQAEEEERRRISRELHDEAGQLLPYARLQLERIEREEDAPPAIVRRLVDAREAIGRTVLEIRRVLSDLSPAVLEQLGLAAAVRQLLIRVHRTHGVSTRLESTGLKTLPEKTAILAYRLVQECCNNVARHSSASHLNVFVASADGTLRMRIQDDGVGFGVAEAFAKPGSYGLAGMRERVALAGGKFEIESAPGRGTRISASIPIPAAAPAAAKTSNPRRGAGRCA